jgi:hypothetical protein
MITSGTTYQRPLGEELKKRFETIDEAFGQKMLEVENAKRRVTRLKI